jgi:DNA-binding response OmpR family regulator
MATVLLAEANRPLREIYDGFLSAHSFQVDLADNGLQCVAKLRHFVPELLILDLNLPWGGGDGVLACLREDPRLLPKRILLTSARESAHIADILASPPSIRALTKPFPLAALLERAALDSFTKLLDSRNRGKGRGILVVDDEPAIRDLLKTHLHDNGFRVWTAPSGEEALNYCCEHGEEIAVVFLDLHMPAFDGPKTLAGIRALDVNLPLCFMTNGSSVHEARELLRLGARRLFQKPFRLKEIVAFVRDLMKEQMQH